MVRRLFITTEETTYLLTLLCEEMERLEAACQGVGSDRLADRVYLACKLLHKLRQGNPLILDPGTSDERRLGL